MLVGILSDSHGRHLAVRQAVALFDRLGAEHIIHCGDVGGVDVFGELVGRPLTFVWGNTDYPDNGVHAYLKTVGIAAPIDTPTRVTLGDKTFAVFHGHEPGFNRALISLDVDYILHGHSHIARDDHRDNTRIINPGALHRARQKTVALLDTARDQLGFHGIDGV